MDNNTDMMEMTRTPMQMTDDEVAEAEPVKRCHLCGRVVEIIAIHRHHDHITGQFL